MSETQVRYLCHKVKGLKVIISIGKRNVTRQAVNGILTVSETESQALDAMMKRGRADLTQNLKKIDENVDAAAVARQQAILAQRQRKGPSAVKGAMHSGNASQEKLRQTDQENREYTAPVKDALPGAYVEKPIHSVPPLPSPSVGGDANANVPVPELPALSGDPGLQNPANAAVPAALASTAVKAGGDSIFSRLRAK